MPLFYASNRLHCQIALLNTATAYQQHNDSIATAPNSTASHHITQHNTNSRNPAGLAALRAIEVTTTATASKANSAAWGWERVLFVADVATLAAREVIVTSL
jgi:hypothetical protein